MQRNHEINMVNCFESTNTHTRMPWMSDVHLNNGIALKTEDWRLKTKKSRNILSKVIFDISGEVAEF